MPHQYGLWENKLIDAKNKNRHRRSKDKIPRRSSNSLKQEFRNGFNLQAFNRLYNTKANKQYSLDKFLKYDNIYDDYDFILYNNDDICCGEQDEIIDIWQCSKCTYINIERLSYCKICQQSYHKNNVNQNIQHDINDNKYENDNNSIISSDSDTSITEYSSLSSYILTSNTKTRKTRKTKIKRKKSAKKSNKNSFKFNDEDYLKYKKFMKKRKTSIIQYKKGGNNGHSKWYHHKIQKEKNNANKLYEMYETIYLSKHKHQDEIVPIIKKMSCLIPKKHLKTVLPQESTNTVCKVCYCDTKDDQDMELIAMNKYCSHCMICRDCFIQYLNITIKEDENILPWILCPAQDCKAPIDIQLLIKYICIDNLYKFGLSFINKHLQRTSFWIECPDLNDKQCKFGWIMIDELKEDIDLKCKSCECNHKLKKENERKDDGFDSLIKSGIMRECPQCNYPAMKDYGMCNVMHCGKCGIYWNWRTKETGTSTNEVKQKARSDGTLWEPGELSYQQNLQNDNLPEFIALLARNGIKYDPNYRRGS